MALINLRFSSSSLGMDTSVNILLPEQSKGAPSLEKYPVLYLLHGIGGNEDSWLKNTSIERYAKDLGIIIVMPAGARSFYTDMHYGYKYFTYITEELPKFLKTFFPISDDYNHTFIAGLSMGGYGALKIGLTCTNKYSAICSLSGAVDLRNSMVAPLINEEFSKEMINVFGLDKLDDTEHDLIYLSKEYMKNSSLRPLIYQFCGTEDFLYHMNRSFKNFIETETNFPFIYEEEPGEHDWSLWDKKIISFLNILKNKFI